jgi:stress response protein SCP2
MSVNLQKGQKVELKKRDGGTLSSVMVGLGWDEVRKKGGFFSSLLSNTQDIDCDASAFLCQGGKVVDVSDIVYFGNLKHKSGAVQHMGDNLTGEGDGDDEQILVDLRRLPECYDKLIFVVNIYKAQERRQHFGLVENAFIRICDDKGQELCKYNLSEHYDNMMAMVFGELYRYNGVWKFSAIGQPTKDNSISELVRRFQ